MNIVILVRIMWTGGAQKIAIKETEYIQKLGHNVKLIFLRKVQSGELLLDMLKGLNWEIYSESNRSNWVYSSITSYFSPDRKGEGTVDYDLISDFAKGFSKFDADYIICHDQFAGIAGYKIKRRLGISYSVFIHERVDGYYSKPILGMFARHVEKKVLANASFVFSVTEKVSKSIQQLYSIPSYTNLPGIELESCIPYQERENILLCVSVWDKDRDPQAYLPIISKLKNFRLIIAGRWRDNSLRNLFVTKIEDLNLKNQVTLVEKLTEEQLKNLYKKAKFCLRYGKDEMGPGMSNLESLSQCTPIIVNGELGFADFIRVHGVGFVSELWNYKDICEYIINKDEAQNYLQLQRNIKKAIKVCSWQSHAQSLIVQLLRYDDQLYRS